MIRHTTTLLLASALAAQGSDVVQTIPLHVPPKAEDMNPDPRVFETVLVASERQVEFLPGKKAWAMTFNGGIPGPTIEVAVGDTLVVHFVNLLGEPSSIHWHGLATRAAMDGTKLSQRAVPRSGTFRYELKLRHPGTYWYHPHIHTNEQIEKGLYGAVIVRDPAEEARLKLDGGAEQILFLDDIQLDDAGQIAAFASDLSAKMEPWRRAEDLANSRLGTHLLLNGRVVTPDRVPVLDVRAGQPTRLRMICVTNGQIMRMDLSDPKARWWGIGSDQGLWNQAEAILPVDKVKNTLGHHQELISNPDPGRGLLMTPSDRLDLVYLPAGEMGSQVTLRAHDFQKGKHIAFTDPEAHLLFGHDHFDGANPPQPLLRLRVTQVGGEGWQPPSPLRATPIEQLVPDPGLPDLPVLMGHSMPMAATGDVMFFVTVGDPAGLIQKVQQRQVALPIDHDPLPMFKQRPEHGLSVKLGQTRVFYVVNFTGSDHNFHMHGFPFQHLGTEFVDLDEEENNRKVPPLRLSFEDTLRVPKRPGLVLGRSYTIMRLVARFDDSHLPASLRRANREMLAYGLHPREGASGGWLLHCHFLEHSRRGMQTFVQVRER